MEEVEAINHHHRANHTNHHHHRSNQPMNLNRKPLHQTMIKTLNKNQSQLVILHLNKHHLNKHHLAAG